MNTSLSRCAHLGLLFVALAGPWISACGRTGTSHAPPHDLGTGPTAHSVTLNWLASKSAVAGYNVYRSTEAGGPLTKLNSSLVRATSYTDATVHSGQTYLYVVTAVDGKGKESVFSNEVKAVVPSP